MLGGGRAGAGKNRRWVELLLAAPALWGCTSETCFVAATLIATPRGPRPIGSLRCGDSVWSHDPTQGLVERRVEAVHCARARVICQLEVGGALVRGVTPSHPIYDAAAQRYTELRQLNAASRLLVFCDGVPKTCSIDRIHIEEAPDYRIWQTCAFKTT
jgi:hypothetical protein